MSEESFWRATPRKINALYKTHRHFLGWDKEKQAEEEEVYTIDQLPFL